MNEFTKYLVLLIGLLAGGVTIMFYGSIITGNAGQYISLVGLGLFLGGVGLLLNTIHSSPMR